MKDLAISADAKKLIAALVQEYIISNPREYQAFVAQQELYRAGFLNDTASMKGVDHRPLYDMPETLYKLIVERLPIDILKEFKGIRGSRWFARTYKAFAVPTEI